MERISQTRRLFLVFTSSSKFVLFRYFFWDAVVCMIMSTIDVSSSGTEEAT